MKKVAKRRKVAAKPVPAKKTPSAPPDQALGQEDVTSAVQLIKEFEGFVPHSYWDPHGKVWTIGYGTVYFPDGSKVHKQMTCTRDQAAKWLAADIERSRVPAIERMCKVPITNPMLNALISLAYNIGNGGLSGSSVMRALNGGQSKIRVADCFLQYIKGGGRVLPGLVRRRKAERELFLTEGVGVVRS